MDTPDGNLLATAVMQGSDNSSLYHFSPTCHFPAPLQREETNKG
jgi:hypothetical protein